ncbi:hypothetical protein VKS41_004380 [Umbelopsis sp. WA50703]
MAFNGLVARSFKRSLGQNFVIKRHAHKKASIDVKLNQYIEGLGLKDDIVSVRPGLMRNVLHPTKQASYIDKYNGPRDRNTAVVQSEVQQVLDPSIAIRRNDTAARKLFSELSSLQAPLEFVRIPIPDTTSTFGSVTNEDIVEKLKEHGISVDKKAILSDKIKNLGRHDITIKCGETDISIGVNITAA